jgi:hypothetical protein
MAKLRTVLTIQYADELPPEEPVMPAEPIEKKKEKKEKKSSLLSKVGDFFSNLFGRFKGKKTEPEEQEEEPTLVEPEPPAVDRKARKEALIQKASEIVKQHQENIKRQHPPSSIPGEYPARRSGKLQRSVYFKPRTPESLEDNDRVKIGYKSQGKPDPAFYSKILAARGRLGLADTADNSTMSNQFGQIEIRYPGDRS